MNAAPKIRDWKPFIWPAVGIFIGVLVAVNPFFTPEIPLPVGIAGWFAEMVLVSIVLMYPMRARAAVLLTGLFLAVPCFMAEAPLWRALLMCLSFLAIAIATVGIMIPPGSFTERLAYLCSWCGTREVSRRMRRFDTPSLIQFAVAAIVLFAAIAVVKAMPDTGVWLLVRWLAGGIMIFAFAETATACHYFLTALVGVTAPAWLCSPYLSISLREFWTTRWNPATSMIFLKFCFEPLSRYGAVFALCACFVLSGIIHMLLALMALGRWDLSIMFGAFFVAQIPFVLMERLIHLRRWPSVWKRIWTLSVLAFACPLIVEPTFQIIQPSWGPPNLILPPTLGVIGFVVIADLCYVLISLASCPATVANEQFVI
jgi:hypothetical protein